MADALTAELADMFPDVVAWRKVTARDGLGKPTAWAASVDMPALVIGQHSVARTASGQLKDSTVYAIVGGHYAVEEGDEFTLPARFVPNQPPAVEIKFQSDENGPHHVEIYF